MDIVTHGLASLAVARGCFPRAGKLALAGAVFAGCFADIDWLSNYFSPSAFLTWHGTFAHSILAAVFISAMLFSIPLFTSYCLGFGIALESTGGLPDLSGPPTAKSLILRRLFLVPFLLPLCAALLHIAMDACQSDGVMLLWPFSSRRFAADWLPGIDPWILALLIGAIAIPELLRLVGSEIGARTKKPRGQTGALIGLFLVLAYVGMRGYLHSNVITLLGSRTFHGEAARGAWAYPESLSLFTWHGVVETESALDELDVNALSPGDFDPDSSLRIFKPEPSPALEAARNTSVVKRFLRTAQVPKARLERTETGFALVLRDLRASAVGAGSNEIAAYVELDQNNRVTSQELVWARDLPQ